MPIEISELSVKLSVGQLAAAAAPADCGPGQGRGKSDPPDPQQIEELFEGFARRVELLRRHAEAR